MAQLPTMRAYPPLAQTDAKAAAHVVDSLLASPMPLAAMSALAQRSTSPSASAFERYAGLALREAGACTLAASPAAARAALEAPHDGKLARIRLPDTPDAQLEACAARVENALNRLLDLKCVLEGAALSASSRQPRVNVSFLGLERGPQDRRSWRGDYVELALLGATGWPDAAYFCEADWMVADHIASSGRAVFQSSLRPNMRQSVLGAFAPAGSDWDIRTRLAALLEGLELPLRFDYRFDCDAETGCIQLDLRMPYGLGLPSRYPGAQGPADGLGSRLPDACAAYALRLCCLFACACFGAGRHVEHVRVRIWACLEGAGGQNGGDPNDERTFGEKPGTGGPVGGNPGTGGEGRPLAGGLCIDAAFERYAFVRTALAALDSGTLAESRYRFDAPGLAELLNAKYLSCELDGKRIVGTGEAPELGRFTFVRRDVADDERPLPGDLAALFGAQSVRDMDTAQYFGGNSRLIELAKEDAAESTMAGIARLEAVVDLLEGSAHPSGREQARPLFCGSPFARIALPLLRDELAVGSEAEAFLARQDAGIEGAENVDELLRESDAGGAQAQAGAYFRVPDALFHAHAGLSDLYQHIGDFRGAAAHADRCMALAPTTAEAYFRKSDVLAQQTRYAEAANVLLAGLRCAISKQDCALLYYHLGLVLWRLGKRSDAAAVFVYCSTLRGPFAERAAQVAAKLRKRADAPVIASAAPLAAAREMSAMRIPIAPSDEARHLVARAALGLACANAPAAAAPYAAELSRYLAQDRVIAASCASIVSGLSWQ